MLGAWPPSGAEIRTPVLDSRYPNLHPKIDGPHPVAHPQGYTTHSVFVVLAAIHLRDAMLCSFSFPFIDHCWWAVLNPVVLKLTGRGTALSQVLCQKQSNRDGPPSDQALHSWR